MPFTVLLRLLEFDPEDPFDTELFNPPPVGTLIIFSTSTGIIMTGSEPPSSGTEILSGETLSKMKF